MKPLLKYSICFTGYFFCFLGIGAIQGCSSSPVAKGEERTPANAATPEGYAAFTQAISSADEARINRETQLVLEKQPDDQYVLNGLAHFYRKSGKHAMAETLARRVLNKNPGDLRAKKTLGLLQLERKEDSKALQLFLEIHAVDKSFPGVAENIASLYLKYERDEQALAVLRETLEAKDLAGLLKSDSGKELSVAYLGIVEANPGVVSKEEPFLRKLTQQKVDSKLAERAKNLLGKRI